MHVPLETHWQEVKGILRYLARTLDLGLVVQSCLGPTTDIERFCDADWASNVDD